MHYREALEHTHTHNTTIWYNAYCITKFYSSLDWVNVKHRQKKKS